MLLLFEKEQQGDVFLVDGVLRAEVLLAHEVFHEGKKRVVDRHGEPHEVQAAHEDGAVEREVRGVPVSADEAARAELDAAEIARDDADGVYEAALLDGLKDRVARSAARLAVVVRLLPSACGAEHPGARVVTRVIVLLFAGYEKGARLVFRRCMYRLRDEARPLDLVFSLAGLFDRREIFHVLSALPYDSILQCSLRMLVYYI